MSSKSTVRNTKVPPNEMLHGRGWVLSLIDDWLLVCAELVDKRARERAEKTKEMFDARYNLNSSSSEGTSPLTLIVEICVRHSKVIQNVWWFDTAEPTPPS